MNETTKEIYSFLYKAIVNVFIWKSKKLPASKGEKRTSENNKIHADILEVAVFDNQNITYQW
jgi:hypothetical protein